MKGALRQSDALGHRPGYLRTTGAFAEPSGGLEPSTPPHHGGCVSLGAPCRTSNKTATVPHFDKTRAETAACRGGRSAMPLKRRFSSSLCLDDSLVELAVPQTASPEVGFALGGWRAFRPRSGRRSGRRCCSRKVDVAPIARSTRGGATSRTSISSSRRFSASSYPPRTVRRSRSGSPLQHSPDRST